VTLSLVNFFVKLQNLSNYAEAAHLRIIAPRQHSYFCRCWSGGELCAILCKFCINVTLKALLYFVYTFCFNSLIENEFLGNGHSEQVFHGCDKS